MSPSPPSFKSIVMRTWRNRPLPCVRLVCRRGRATIAIDPTRVCDHAEWHYRTIDLFLAEQALSPEHMLDAVPKRHAPICIDLGAAEVCKVVRPPPPITGPM